LTIGKIYKDGKEIFPDGPVSFNMDFTKSKDFVIEIQNTDKFDDIVNPELVTDIDKASLEIKSMPGIIPPGTTKEATVTLNRLPLLALAANLRDSTGKATASIKLRYERVMKIFTS